MDCRLRQGSQKNQASNRLIDHKLWAHMPNQKDISHGRVAVAITLSSFIKSNLIITTGQPSAEPLVRLGCVLSASFASSTNGRLRTGS
jgi:hypothetical protein